MKKIILALLVLVASPVEAACTRPSGTFVGSGSGELYNRTTGTKDITSLQLSVTLLASGAATITEVGKNYSQGTYTQTYSIPANSTFNTTTCLGSVTTSLGLAYNYTVASSGTQISFIHTGSDPTVASFSIILQKAY